MRMVSVYDPKALYSIMIKDVEFYPKHTTPSEYVSDLDLCGVEAD